MLSYVRHTTPPPPGVQIPAGNATCPGDTHHAVNLPFSHPEPAPLEQF
jgi:hypothetical protein